MKNVRLAPSCLWVPKTPGGGTRLEIGAFYHRLAGGSSKRHPVLTRKVRGATKIVEPPRDEILCSCRLALAFEKVLAEGCYGSMYRKLPAFPCVGFVRLNDMGLAGICESDLTSGMTFLMLQGFTGRPGFVSKRRLAA
jgi:L-fucose isomerase-like protein